MSGFSAEWNNPVSVFNCSVTCINILSSGYMSLSSPVLAYSLPPIVPEITLSKFWSVLEITLSKKKFNSMSPGHSIKYVSIFYNGETSTGQCGWTQKAAIGMCLNLHSIPASSKSCRVWIYKKLKVKNLNCLIFKSCQQIWKIFKLSTRQTHIYG